MEVLNKFCSTVQNTVSQLSVVLPGNPVTREYEVANHIASAGPGLYWKIFSGFKKSTKQPASIFVLEKRQVVVQDRELLFETLKKGVAQLTKLRHPQILVVQHPIEESRDCLAFATEPVFASLANVLGKTENMPSQSDANDYKLYDVEIKYGLLQLGEGLAFLHRDAKILHHNLCPSSVVINEQGAWKIFGFDFALQNTSSDATPSWKCPDYKSCSSDVCRPDLDYLAPECGLSEKAVASSDIYSLGVLIYAIYNSGKPIFVNSTWRAYDANVGQLKSLHINQLISIAEGVRVLVKSMLNYTPELRPDEHDFLKTDFFEDVGVKALNYLDSIFQWDNRQKSHFYKGLPQILDKLPHRVCLYRVVPCLAKEFVNPMMVPFVLPSIFAISENCSKKEFSTIVFPQLKQIMQIQDPVQILYLFMQKMDLLLKMTPHDDVKKEVLPLLYRALESDAQEIQELCLSVLPGFANLIEYPSMKNALLPRIKRLCLSTSHVSVRVNCLVCIGKLLDNLDKWLVMDEVLPFLPQIPSKEPAVLMGILGIYKLVLNHKKMTISKEIMAQKVIPFLMPLSVENFLTLNQFNAIVTLIKDMVGRVEAEHRVKLEQLNDQNKTLESNMPKTLDSSNGGETLQDFFGMKKNSPEASLGSLSLVDKRKTVSDGEKARKMATLPSAVPGGASTAKEKSQIRDMTDLLDANNFSLSLNVKSAPQSFPRSNYYPSLPPTMSQFTTVTTAVGFTPRFSQPSTLPVNNTSTFSNGSLINNGSVRPSPTEWSSWTGPTTAISMSTPQQRLQAPLLPPSSSSSIGSFSTSSTAPKTLSKDEINDLLG